jgi:hypothetical protein
MSLTRLDCHFYRGERAASDVSSFVALNPMACPSRLVFAGSTAIRESLGSQVAYRLALDYFVHGVQGHYAGPYQAKRQQDPEDAAVGVLEDAFRSANASVYSFGHKLAAGGRMAASLLGLVMEDGRIAAGRVGLGSVYLFRGNQLFPFFSGPESGMPAIGDTTEFPDEELRRKGSYIGQNSVVDVELASVKLEGEDIVCVFSRPLTQANETLLFECLDSLTADGFPVHERGALADLVCKEVFNDPESLSFAMVVAVGPEAVYCTRTVDL